MFSLKKKETDKNVTPVVTSMGLWKKCEKCSATIYNKEWEESFRVCPNCGHHYPLSARERIQLLTDPGSFEEKNAEIAPTDFLDFKYLDTTYAKKIKENQAKTGLNDAIITGNAKIAGKSVNIACMEFEFIGGSMGSVVGEKFTRAGIEALKNKKPFIVISTSGGARMQEGLTSLLQMAKTSAIVARLKKQNIPYIVILTDPTYGGITASFAMLGDITIAEPKAMIGFAGARVIEQTIKQKLPDGFQSAEFLLDHGFIDLIVERKKLKETLINILSYINEK